MRITLAEMWVSEDSKNIDGFRIYLNLNNFENISLLVQNKFDKPECNNSNPKPLDLT